jgi:4-phospho-D-threonate 3-dehydrogenase / 4-phospho-D-erythronate 3-dehydrogenase
MSNPTKPISILAITMGDPAGIGPEIAAKAFADATIYDRCHPLLIGNAIIMEKAIGIVNVELKINKITEVSQAKFKPGTMDVFDIGGPIDQVRFGEVSSQAGDIAFRCVKTAIELAMEKKVDGTVTGPINKEALNKAGHHYSGHTEIYAHFTNTPKFAMLLADGNFRVIHVTTHVSLRKACDMITKDRVLDVIRLLNDGLKKIGLPNPRIGVAGLNPHSSDGGLFGSEEADEILPAVQEAKKMGIIVDGPVPADTLFALAKGGKFDGCVAMYHDQGHIPFKFLGFVWNEKKQSMESVKGVNITLGLPIIRTSVDHGTAFQVAGKGIASPDALLDAIDYAIRLCN